jgi:hypothetical protein
MESASWKKRSVDPEPDIYCFELIISDNASTDRTGEIAQAYANRDDRIRYYRSEKNMVAGWTARRVYELGTGNISSRPAPMTS